MKTTGEMTWRAFRLTRATRRFRAGLACALLVAVSLTARMYGADGDLDLTFGVDGKVISDIRGLSNVASAVAIDAHDRIVVAGHLLPESAGPYLALARYNSDGSLDTTFGDQGIVHGDAGAFDAAIDRNGKIVVVSQQDTLLDPTITRYGEDGILDASFGTGGRTTTLCGGWTRVAADAAGRIVVAGSSFVAGTSVLCVTRHNEDGSLDTTFGTGGFTSTPVGTSSVPRALAIHSDGRIVLAGYAYSADSLTHPLLAGYTDSGSLDSGFGTSGTILENLPAGLGFSDVAFDSEGRVVVSASLAGDRREFFAARYTVNGAPDTDFDGDGQVIVNFVGEGSYYDARAEALAIDGEGRIVMAGQFTDSLGTDAVLARLNPDGSLDTSFGIDGMRRTNFAESDYVAAVAVDHAGRVVLGGSAGNGSRFGFDFALARYEGGSSRFEFSGFFAPVDNAPARNVVKAGRAVPVKFSLNGYHGLDILAAGSPASQQIACEAGARLDVLEETLTASGSSLTYDAVMDQYIYVWKTEKAWANTCRQLVVTLTDGTSHVANFQLSN